MGHLRDHENSMQGVAYPPGRQIFRWPVPADFQAHAIGSGRILHMASRLPAVHPDGPVGMVEIWTEEDGNPELTRFVQIFAEGHALPDDVTHIGSDVDGYVAQLVWHVYEYAKGGGA